ncbi:MAG: hypothetical protein L0154_21000 [Chloroflexi bacterium]|nr:hypothetical protein [Chloroflexota bacterium]
MTEDMHTEDQEAKQPFEKFVDKQRQAAEEFTKALEELFPPGFREHTKKAGQVFVESFRDLFEAAREDFEDLVNRAKERGEDVAEDVSDSSTGDTKVKVDVE